MSAFKTSYPRTGNGTKPKSRIGRLTPSRSLIPSLVGNTSKRPPELGAVESSTLARRTLSERKSPRRHSEERQAHHSPKRSPRRFLSSLDDDSFQDEMGLGLRLSSMTTTSVDVEPGMSFLEFETLYTLEKELSHSRCCSQDVTQLEEKRAGTSADWLGGKRGVYTELPHPLCHQAGASVASSQLAQLPEGFSFAPGWSLNADHFYQWQHRGKSTQQVVCDRSQSSYLVLGP